MDRRKLPQIVVPVAQGPALSEALYRHRCERAGIEWPTPSTSPGKGRYNGKPIATTALVDGEISADGQFIAFPLIPKVANHILSALGETVRTSHGNVKIPETVQSLADDWFPPHEGIG